MNSITGDDLARLCVDLRVVRTRRRAFVLAAVIGGAAAFYAEIASAGVSGAQAGVTFAAVLGCTLALGGLLGWAYARIARSAWHRHAVVHYAGGRSSEPCHICHVDENAGSCVRCAEALCPAHLPAIAGRCDTCESHFVARIAQGKPGLLYAAIWIAPWLVFVTVASDIAQRFPRSGGPGHITTGLPVLDVAIMTLVAGFVLAGGALEVRRLLLRRRFASERPSH